MDEIHSSRVASDSDEPPICSIAKKFDIDSEILGRLNDRFAFKATSHYLSLIESKDDPIYKQIIPDPRELELNPRFSCDPLNEDEDSPAEGIVHRYPDRVLFLVSNTCFAHCRFCTRTRKVSHPDSIKTDEYKEAFDYIRKHTEIRDVIVSGGDPLCLSDSKIDYILSSLRSIEHIEVIRIGSRATCFQPKRITDELCSILKKYHPLYMNCHFNHPRELTKEACEALAKLADSGIPLGCQTVLMKGVNDDPVIMKELMKKLVRNRVRPYYIFMMDKIEGGEHFRTSLDTGINIIDKLRGWTSGICVPQLVIDSPGGGGKIPILPEYLLCKKDNIYEFRNYEFEKVLY